MIVKDERLMEFDDFTIVVNKLHSALLHAWRKGGFTQTESERAKMILDDAYRLGIGTEEPR